QLKHENIVSLIEVFRRKGKLYLVFEYVEKTILEEIEKNPEGLDPTVIRSLMWQLVRAIQFCHQNNIIHRDIKPENLLVSKNGVLKLCDFGFARTLAAAGAKYTDYVSTRWYRAPELLVGDVSYGKAVDIWAVGCMFAEITTGLPLFPGDSDIDQLYHIIKCLGRITSRQQELFRKNSLYVGVKLPEVSDVETLEDRFPQFDKVAIDFLKQTVQDEPLDRWTCAELLQHPLIADGADEFDLQLRECIAKDIVDNMVKPTRRQKKPTPLSRPPTQPQPTPGNPPPTSTSSVSNEYAPAPNKHSPHNGIAVATTAKSSKQQQHEKNASQHRYAFRRYSTTTTPDTPKKHHHHGDKSSGGKGNLFAPSNGGQRFLPNLCISSPFGDSPSNNGTLLHTKELLPLPTSSRRLKPPMKPVRLTHTYSNPTIIFKWTTRITHLMEQVDQQQQEVAISDENAKLIDHHMATRMSLTSHGSRGGNTSTNATTKPLRKCTVPPSPKRMLAPPLDKKPLATPPRTSQANSRRDRAY
ncbi:hypothetical protein AaE_004148, partial [Aphanomyces astaci]